jgi:hypothetical protein
MAEKEVLVKARQSFASLINGEIHQITKGKIISLPKGADWVKAGLVEVLGKDSKTETANITPPETATVKPAGKGKAAVTPPETATVKPAGKGKAAVTPPETATANNNSAVSTETEPKE